MVQSNSERLPDEERPPVVRVQDLLTGGLNSASEPKYIGYDDSAIDNSESANKAKLEK